MQPYRKVYQYESGDGAGVHLHRLPPLSRTRPASPPAPSAVLYKDAETGLTLYHTDQLRRLPLLRHGLPLRRAVPSGPPARSARARRQRSATAASSASGPGSQPACVHSCPTGALGWHWSDDPEEKSELAHIYESWNALTPSDK